jgi:hypothetical protein
MSTPSSSPGRRAELLALAKVFVVAAVRVTGVRSLSLVGSITSAKENPKDIDLLLVVGDDADIPSLALLGRRVQGRAQGFCSGADIFLADERGRYLGRTCPWKECRPGMHVSCDARHCGARPHLHDDLDDVHLDPELIAAPPVTIWPQLVRRRALPADLEAMLVELAATLESRREWTSKAQEP